MALSLLHFAQQPMLDGRLDSPPPSYSSCVPCKPQDPPRYARKRPSTSLKTKSSRKSLHHHKDATVYEELPIFENPCPICFYKHCQKVLANWIRKSSKPYTAVTVSINRLTSEQYEDDDLSGLVDLIEIIRIQETGPTEAARAIRKKLYATPLQSLWNFLI